MSGEKIDNLNKAVRDMLDAFAQEEKMETEILVSVITFGDQVELHVPYTGLLRCSGRVCKQAV
jgi:uncharacterized protein YegL